MCLADAHTLLEIDLTDFRDKNNKRKRNYGADSEGVRGIMKIKNHLKRAQEIRNDELRMEYLRITMTIAKAEKHFDAFKKDCE